MHTHTLLAIPLSVLFASLLSACPLFPGCDSDTFDSTETVDLTPDEYVQWQQGMMPGAPTTSAGGSTGDAMGTSGGEATSSGSSGGTTGESLTPDEVCAAVCMQSFPGANLTSCSVEELADKVVVTCNLSQACIGGRGHACVRPPQPAAGPDPAAVWLARCAHDEAASVHAFAALGRELAALGAPAKLLARIDSATHDETRHAELVSTLARSAGAEPTPPACVTLPP